ncbi:MAG: hypothetical protein QME94_05420, partial [Anaerolineae bacterium]|nr:hypothetical protein [Anaerolineae bacterium]
MGLQLSLQETEQFYRIWMALLGYANEQRRLVPRAIGKRLTPAALGIEDAAKIRDALWAEDSLRVAFVAENPAGLSVEDLEIANSWGYRVRGHFY